MILGLTAPGKPVHVFVEPDGWRTVLEWREGPEMLTVSIKGLVMKLHTTNGRCQFARLDDTKGRRFTCEVAAKRAHV